MPTLFVHAAKAVQPRGVTSTGRSFRRTECRRTVQSNAPVRICLRCGRTHHDTVVRSSSRRRGALLHPASRLRNAGCRGHDHRQSDRPLYHPAKFNERWYSFRLLALRPCNGSGKLAIHVCSLLLRPVRERQPNRAEGGPIKAPRLSFPATRRIRLPNGLLPTTAPVIFGSRGRMTMSGIALLK